MSYEKMDVYSFGEALLKTQDLDPLYVGLRRAEMEKKQLMRWLLAYWMFYHAGLASYASEREGDAYWGLLERAGANITEAPDGGRWPRATERRHFRGEACLKSIRWFARQEQPPEAFLLALAMRLDDGPLTQKKIMDRVQEWPLFGPWIAFKVADMVDGVLGVPLKFEDDIGLVYKEPAAALDMLLAQNKDGWRTTPEAWWRELRSHFGKLPAPHADRSCGVQEVETICCKWKSHQGGHYWIGKDIHEHRQALEHRGWGETAWRLREAYPREVKRA